MDELAELMGAASDLESVVAAPWDCTSSLAGPGSTGSCKVMDPFIAIGTLREGTSADGEAVFPDSDDSEVNRRRHRHRKIADPLKKLLKKEIPALMKFLRVDLPRSAHILSFINMILKWKESVEMKRGGLKYKIVVAREGCRAGFPLMIACYIWRGETWGTIYAPSYFGVEVLKESFKHSKFWLVDILERNCEWAVYPAEAAAAFLSAKRESDIHFTSYPADLYWMPPDTQMELEVPREFKTNPLEVGHECTVNHYWGRRRSGSEDLIQQMILNNPTIGAFTFNDDFVGWALQTHYGALDVVYTVQKHRKKGVARSLVQSLARTLNVEGSAAHAFAPRDDQNTKTFLTKCGFTFVSEYFYFYIDPPLQCSPNFNNKTGPNVKDK